MEASVPSAWGDWPRGLGEDGSGNQPWIALPLFFKPPHLRCKTRSLAVLLCAIGQASHNLQHGQHVIRMAAYHAQLTDAADCLRDAGTAACVGT